MEQIITERLHDIHFTLLLIVIVLSTLLVCILAELTLIHKTLKEIAARQNKEQD